MAKDRLFFLVSVAFLGLLAAFLFRKPDASEKSTAGVEQQVKEQVVQVLVAQQQLSVGDTLKPEAYAWEEIGSENPDPSLIIKDPTIEKWINEAVAVKEVQKGEKIKRLDILWPQESDSGDNVYVLPAEGNKRAILFHMTERTAVAQFIKQGMFIDIIFSSNPEMGCFTTNSDMGCGSLTVTLLKNIRVLAIGNNGVGKFVSGQPVDILLEVTGRQAELFSYAEQSGVLTLGLIQEGEQPEDVKDDLSDLLLTSRSVGNFNSILITHMIRSLFPNVDINITATQKGYIASGKVHEPQVATKIIEILDKMAEDGALNVVDLLEVVPQQVLLCVRVLEVVKDVKSKLGVNWQALYENAGASVALAAVFPRPLPTDPNYFLQGKGIEIGNFTLTGVIDLLKEKGCGRVLAEPNLTTISGETAFFFAGGEFPILIPQGGAFVGTITVEYKKFGVILEFTPTVDINGLITLHILPEVSTVDRQNSVKLQGFDIPSLISRRAETTVKLWPGQCYVMAGLLQYDWVSKISSLCDLYKLPIIGPLFSSRSFVERRTELMILVTPYLIYSDQETICGDDACMGTVHAPAMCNDTCTGTNPAPMRHEETAMNTSRPPRKARRTPPMRTNRTPIKSGDNGYLFPGKKAKNMPKA